MRITNLKRGFQTVRRILESPPLDADAPPLEIRAAVVDAIEDLIVVVGVGRTSFPYDRIAVRLLAASKEDRAALEQVFADLERRVLDRFAERRCDVPPGLKVAVTVLKKVPPGWPAGRLFAVDSTRSETDTTPRPASQPVLKVAVLNGTATRKTYAFKEPTILIGRDVDPAAGRRVRHNHIAFDGSNATVSRGHARVKYDSARPGYRLLDEGSARGTVIVRGGASIPVPQDPRGVRIQSGDEIHLGCAVIRVTIE